MAKNRVPMTVEVVRGDWVSPSMRRLVLGGPGLADYTPNEFTDAYVKLVFNDGDDQVLRTYTVRSFDAGAGELTIDFVVHGDRGLAGPWARDAQPGETISFYGPGGAYAPAGDADWHLLAGDESALPAIHAAVEVLPADARGAVFVEVDDASHEIDLGAPAGVDVVWLHREGRPAPTEAAESLLARAVIDMEWPDGEPHVFVHGEAHTVMRGIRPYLRKVRGVPPEMASISGYWRRGLDHEDFKEWKKNFNAAEA